MFKTFTLLFCLILTISLASGSTSVYKKDFNKGKIKLFIHQVEVDSFNIINMTNHNSVEMELICAKNPAVGNRKAIVKYTNIFDIEVADFIISDDKYCRDLRDYLIATFEDISFENPLLMELDKQKKVVTKIIYPQTDPYADDLEPFADEHENKLNKLNPVIQR